MVSPTIFAARILSSKVESLARELSDFQGAMHCKDIISVVPILDLNLLDLCLDLCVA